MRALAALSVAMLHAQHDAAALAARLGQAFAGWDFPWSAGVDVFFVISGFIMVYASRDLFAAPGARGIFLARRIARIVPLYWTVTTLYLAVALAAPAVLNSEIAGAWPVLASYLFVPVARPDGTVQPVYSLGWTLNYEMAFYALFAVAVAWPRRQAVLGLGLTLAALAALGRLLAPLPEPFGFWTDPIILEFALGMILGLLGTEGFGLAPAGRIALAILGIGLLWLDLLPPLPRVLAYGVPAAMLIAAAGLGDPGRAMRPAASLGLRCVAALGGASYALYLIHPFAIRAGREAVVRSGLGAALGPWGYVLLALLTAVGAALVVHIALERPLIGRVRAGLSGRGTAYRGRRSGRPAAGP